MFLQDIDFRQHDQSPYEWLCAFDYSDAPIKPPQNVNPLLRPASIIGSSQANQESTITDYQGNAIVNSAGDQYDPTTIPSGFFQWSISKNVSVNSIPSFILTIPFCDNSDTFSIPQLDPLSFPPKTLLASGFGHSDIKTEVIGNANVLYRTFSFVLTFNPETWVYYPIDRGWQGLIYGYESLGKGKFFVHSTMPPGSGQTGQGPLVLPSKPLFMDGLGHSLVAGLPPVEFPTDGYDLFQPFDFTSNLGPYCQ
jgi:hypothetical protein